MKHRSIPVTAAAALAAAALLAAGCGGSKSSSTTTTSAAAATAAQSTPASTQTAAASSTPASGTAVVVSSKHAKPGTVLDAGPKKLTVYMFEGDKGASSSCSGACAQVWPPVTTSAAATAGGAAVSADLGTITRADGTKQVTYKGHPLYFFEKDKDSGDAYGQGVVGFGASWYVIAPSGKKIDES